MRVAKTSGLSATVSGTVLPPGDPGADQLEGVGGIQAGAGLALVRTTVAAPGERHPQRLVRRAVRADQRTGAGVEGLRAADQPDRVSAEPHPGQDLGPVVEVPREQPGHELALGGFVEVQIQRALFPEPHPGQRVPYLVPCCQRHGHPLSQGCAVRLVRPARTAHPVLGRPLQRLLTDAWGRSNAGHDKSTARTRRGVFGVFERLSLCVRPLARVGSRPPGIYPSVLVSAFCMKLSAPLTMAPATDSSPPLPPTGQET